MAITKQFPKKSVQISNDDAVEDCVEERVNHPSHYNQHPSGIECIKIVEHFNYNRGTAIAYIWRAGHKGFEVEDLKKAVWHLQAEIDRLQTVTR